MFELPKIKKDELQKIFEEVRGKSPYLVMGKINCDAARFLLERSVGNRSLSMVRILQYRSLMIKNEWWLSPSAIAIDDTGALKDAHHRLEAVSRLPEEIFVPFTISFNLPKEGNNFIDSGMHRSTAHSLQINYRDEIPEAKAVAEICNAVKKIKTFNKSAKMLVEETAEFYKKHEEVFVYINERFRKIQLFGVSPIKAALLLAHERFPEEVKEFIEEYLTEKPALLNTSSGPYHLRDLVIDTSKNTMGVSKRRVDALGFGIKTFWCLKAYIEKIDYKSLGGPKEEEPAKRLISYFTEMEK